MYRLASDRIKEWLESSNKALLVTGARQIGKTWLIRDEINKSEYDIFEINFINQPELIDYFNVEISATDFLVRLKMILPASYQEKKTVIFFDEIQKCPEIVTKIKFLVDDGSFLYVLSGSLLGVELKNITSAPVGYMTTIRMYPMDFQEFMIAYGVSNATLDMLKEKYEKLEPVDEYIHNKLMDLFYVYLIVGGMPEAVQTYIDTKDIRKVSAIHKDIIEFYKLDFTQYETADKKLKLISIYELIPAELNKQNKRFIFTYLNKELKFDRYENSFLWLKDAGVALPVYSAENPKVPLVASMSSNVFRLFASDTGLLTSCYPDSVKMELIKHDGSINNGALFENAVIQQLVANNLTPYFYKKAKVGEVDAMVELNGNVQLIEVKSGANYKAHKALNNLMDIEEYDFDKAIVLSGANVEVEANIKYIPVYMTYLIKSEELSSSVVDVDIKGL